MYVFYASVLVMRVMDFVVVVTYVVVVVTTVRPCLFSTRLIVFSVVNGGLNVTWGRGRADARHTALAPMPVDKVTAVPDAESLSPSKWSVPGQRILRCGKYRGGIIDRGNVT